MNSITHYANRLKNGAEVVFNNPEALIFNQYLTDYEKGLSYTVWVNFEKGKTKFKLITK